MNADYQHLGLSDNRDKIDAFWVNTPKFGFHWHYHPELEITCIKQGRGTRMVGDNVSSFEAGDFVLMGSNLPHTWISDDDFNRAESNMEVAVLQFSPTLLQSTFLSLVEMKNIQRLLTYANRGLVFNQIQNDKAAQLLYQLIDATGLDRLLLFLTLLDYLGSTSTLIPLASKAYLPTLNESTEERILNVCRYVHKKFTDPIKLETVAQIANMNPTSFCRFFKKSTGQTFSNYLNDLRIGKACNLLLDQRNFSIAEVAYQSGFNSQTLFNRIFFKKKQLTPRDFRKLKQGK